jgi:response regulator NasT
MTAALRILVAEDERDTREYLVELLSRLGHQAVGVENGRQLVDLARQVEPDLVLADIQMPELDGIRAAELVNAERDTPFFLVSAHHEAELLQRVVADHIMAYLVKPVKEAAVKVALAVAMARFRQYQEVRKEAADLRQALEDRKVIERAKGALMGRLRVDEEEAFRRLRKAANDGSLKLVAAARRVLAADEVLRELEGAPAGRTP